MKPRSYPVRDSSERMFLHCRWFYQPSDTCFPCSGFGKETYFSNHFSDVPVSKIKRRVSIVFMVEGKRFPLNGQCEKDMKSSSCVRVDDRITDFVCKFFYDHENESLYQIKFGS
ncbi:hypothetical protein SUGI_0805620 [Cryptomeria japonica]|nr:hypothetical protein SUGI_0805620 [Cryptomeria japonica]